MRRAATAGTAASLLLGCGTQVPGGRPEPTVPPASVPVPAGRAVEHAVFLEVVVDVKPEIIRLDPPMYPDSLRAWGVQGRVVLEFIIDTLGRVEPGSPGVVESPHPGLSDAAMRSVSAAVFRPAEIAQHRVRVLVRLPMDFALRPREEP